MKTLHPLTLHRLQDLMLDTINQTDGLTHVAYGAPSRRPFEDGPPYRTFSYFGEVTEGQSLTGLLWGPGSLDHCVSNTISFARSYIKGEISVGRTHLCWRNIPKLDIESRPEEGREVVKCSVRLVMVNHDEMMVRS